MKPIFILFIFISLAFTSCKDVIQIKLEKGEKLLVVDAFLDNSADTQKVRLTFNDDYFSNTHPPPALGATVTLSDLTNATTYTFVPDRNGNYLHYPQVND